MVLEHFFGYLLGKRHGAKTAIRELEISMRAKDPATPVEDTELYSTIRNANVVFNLNFTASGILVWFATRKAPKFLGIPPLPRSLSLIYSLGSTNPLLPYVGRMPLVRSRYHLDPSHQAALSYHGCGSIFGDMRHYEFYQGSAANVLKGEEGMKMELAKIILDKHSTDNSLVEVLKRHFIAENLLSDQHQEQPVFRWRQRNSYVDCTFIERIKESKANNLDGDDEAESSMNTRIFEEDSLACILGTPGNNTKISKPPEYTGGTILTRRELQVHRRSHRHRRQRRAEKTAAL